MVDEKNFGFDVFLILEEFMVEMKDSKLDVRIFVYKFKLMVLYNYYIWFFNIWYIFKKFFIILIVRKNINVFLKL